MKLFILPFFLLTFCYCGAQPCDWSRAHPSPVLSEATRQLYTEEFNRAGERWLEDSADADRLIWVGRRAAYLGHYPGAIVFYTKGIMLHPGNAKFYRHRGHRYITMRCFDKAIDDFKTAARLFNGKPDEIEPDGIPNAKNIPTSTLQSNTWYHLGLAYFLKGDFKRALKAYRECLAVSKNKDMYVATANWLNITYRKLKMYKQAIALYNSIPEGELIENRDYMLLLDMHREKRTAQQVDEYAAAILPKDQSLGSATLNFGIGYYCLLYGYTEKAKAYFNKAMAIEQWSSFGYIAAEAELLRMKAITRYP
jgi:tetratricopeptide (TPR) repeat protein